MISVDVNNPFRFGDVRAKISNHGSIPRYVLFDSIEAYIVVGPDYLARWFRTSIINNDDGNLPSRFLVIPGEVVQLMPKHFRLAVIWNYYRNIIQVNLFSPGKALVMCQCEQCSQL